MSDSSSISTLPSTTTTLTPDKYLTSTQTSPLDMSTTSQTSGASLESKKQTSGSLPTIGVSSLPPEIASSSIIQTGMTPAPQSIPQDSVAKTTPAFGLESDTVSQAPVAKNTVSEGQNSKSSNAVSQNSVGTTTSSNGLDSKSSSTIPTTSSTSNSLESTTPKSYVESPRTTLNQSSLSTSPSKEVSPSSTPLPTQVRAKINETAAVLVHTSNKTQESAIVPVSTQNQAHSAIPEAVKQQPNITAIRANVNSTTSASLENSSKKDTGNASHSGGTALIILSILFIGIIFGLLFWRRRRRGLKERRNAAAGMEKVDMNGTSGDLEKGEYLSDGSQSMTETDENQHDSKGGYFGKRGIIRSSRPRSLLLKEAAQGANNNTFAVNQTPSVRSQQASPGSNHDGLQVPGVHLRSNRLQNRPNSWRSSIAVAWASLGIPVRLLNEPSNKHSPGVTSLDRSNSSSTNGSHKKPLEAQTYRPPAPHPRVHNFQGPAADHERRADRLSQVIREEEESYVSSSVEDGSSSLQSESPTMGSSMTGSYTESSIGSSKLSRSSSSGSGSGSERMTESLNSSSTFEGSHSEKSTLQSRSGSVSGSDESHTISSKANSFFTEEIGLNQIHSNHKIGSQVSLNSNPNSSIKTQYNHNHLVGMIVHGNAM